MQEYITLSTRIPLTCSKHETIYVNTTVTWFCLCFRGIGSLLYLSNGLHDEQCSSSDLSVTEMSGK